MIRKAIFTFILVLALAAFLFIGFDNDNEAEGNNVDLKEDEINSVEDQEKQEPKIVRESDPVKNEVKPKNVPLINQLDNPRLYNGCEITSLAMLLQYNGFDVTKNELADKVKKVPLNYENGLKGDPNEGFVGNMEDGPGLGVYHEPVYELARSYAGNRVTDLSGRDLNEMYKELSKGNPVWVITTADFTQVDDIEQWETPNGKVEITYSVHSVVVTGYNEKSVFVNDPYGYKNRKVDRAPFEKSLNQLGKQMMVIQQ
ncbi:C39 family peptidase [Bacillus gobiensis]|uniref:C39 family peptidase n=1 Tax=Bacillus gobiensis TaxID=1441095 RepID=UPI003D204E76